MIIFAGRGFNAAVDVHGLRGNKGDGFCDVFFLQAPGKDEGMGFFHLDGNVPIRLKTRAAVTPLITGIHQNSPCLVAIKRANIGRGFVSVQQGMPALHYYFIRRSNFPAYRRYWAIRNSRQHYRKASPKTTACCEPTSISSGLHCGRFCIPVARRL